MELLPAHSLPNARFSSSNLMMYLSFEVAYDIIITKLAPPFWTSTQVNGLLLELEKDLKF